MKKIAHALFRKWVKRPRLYRATYTYAYGTYSHRIIRYVSVHILVTRRYCVDIMAHSLKLNWSDLSFNKFTKKSNQWSLALTVVRHSDEVIPLAGTIFDDAKNKQSYCVITFDI